MLLIFVTMAYYGIRIEQGQQKKFQRGWNTLRISWSTVVLKGILDQLSGAHASAHASEFRSEVALRPCVHFAFLERWPLPICGLFLAWKRRWRRSQAATPRGEETPADFPLLRLEWQQVPVHGMESTKFTVEVHHGGYFFRSESGVTYMDEKSTVWFDNLDRNTLKKMSSTI